MSGIRLAVLMVAAAGPAAAIAPRVGEICNLVRNGGFEEGGRMPSAWARYPARDANGNCQYRDTNAFHSGRGSGLITSVVAQPPGTSSMQWSQYKLPVEGGSSVIVSMRAKSEGVPVHGGGLHFYDGKGAHLGFTGVPGPAAPAVRWTHWSRTVEVPEGARTMGFVAYARNGGTTWYDDLAVIGTPSLDAARATPVLDGGLAGDCWNEAGGIGAFVAHTGDAVVAQPVRAWVAHDDDCLFVAFRCPHAPGAVLRERAAVRDGDVWLDDSIEVFLDPQHGHKDYFHIVVNSRGVIRDAHGRDTAWDSGARAAVAREQAAWTVELAIPLEGLGLGLDTGRTWGMNLAWNDRVRGGTATWSLGGFHAPGRFGNVMLSPDLGRFCRADLAPNLEALERARLAVQSELEGVELAASGREACGGLLDDARAATEGLRRYAEPAERQPEGGWDFVRRRRAEIRGMIASARAAAVDALYDAAPSGSAGFRVALAHAMQKIRRSGPVTDGMLARGVRLEAARDEAESFQVVVIPDGQPLRHVGVDAGPLSGPGGALPLKWHRVGYVETSKPGYPVEHVGWWPDPLLPAGPFDVAAGERQPLWVTAEVPPDAVPGVYRGAITVRHGGMSRAVPVELRVRGFRLPRPGTLAAPFSLYQPQWARWWFGKEAGRMPVETFVRWSEFMGRYRLTPKNIAREYIAQTGAGATVRVDLGGLARTVVPLAPRWFAPYSFNLCRMPSAASIGKAAGTTNSADAAACVKAWADEWRRLSLPGRVYIYGYDEPRPEHYPFLCEAYRRIREAVPGYPIMQTIGDPQPEALAGLVDIWCPLTPGLASDFYAKRLKSGDTLWTYVCCSPKPPHANFFVDEPAIDHRILFWQARQHGATGVLYWSTAWWEGLPTAASGKPCFPDVPIRFEDLGTYREFKVNGDGLLLYPGRDMEPLPSVRLEVIRDGIEDYECLALLARLVDAAAKLPRNRRPADGLLAKARELVLVPPGISRGMTDFTKDPNAIFERRLQINTTIDDLEAAIGGR